MTSVDVIGLGAWSDHFSSMSTLHAGLQSGEWPEQPALSPAAIPPRERRRAPQTVKMAMETMSQAFAQSGLTAGEVSVVTASAMGDMEITDYMCSTLATHPHLISPTQFHNSVHNAAVGYWSISQASHAACNAVAAGEFSGPGGLLEAVMLCVDAQCPVLLVIQEGRATPTIMSFCAALHPVSLAMLVVPEGSRHSSGCLARLRLQLDTQPCQWPDLPERLAAGYGDSPAGRMLPVFAVLAEFTTAPPARSQATGFALPLTAHSSLRLELCSPENPAG